MEFRLAEKVENMAKKFEFLNKTCTLFLTKKSVEKPRKAGAPREKKTRLTNKENNVLSTRLLLQHANEIR